MTKRTSPVTLLSFLVAAAPLTAHADLQWVSPEASGCATSIAVAPNNIPWVVGCGPGPDNGIYYLQPVWMQTSCQGICFPTWAFADGYGRSVATDYEGNAYVIGAAGQVWAADFLVVTSFNSPPPTTPTGSWSELSPNASGGFAAVGWPSPGGCITSLAVTMNADIDEAFVTPNFLSFGGPYPYYYGVGCYSNPNNSIYVYSPDNGVRSWAQVDAQDNAAAVNIAMFTVSLPTGSIQTPWTLNAEGGLYSYDRNSGRFVGEPGPDGFAYALTDHFVAVSQGSPGNAGVYEWNDGTQSWVFYMSLFTASGTQITQIAHAGVRYSSAGAIGPSALWGIDSNGGIYYAADVAQGQ
jgi:hypothetical protein